MGRVVSGITDAVGLTDTEAAETYAKDAQTRMEWARQRLTDIGIPEIEQQRILLEQPELVGQLVAEQLGPSAFEGVRLDPRLREQQMAALEMLAQRGREGLTAEDRLAFRELQQQAMGDEASRQRDILSGMAQRGALDSGSQLAAQLASSQASSQQAQAQASQMARAALEAKRNALAQAAQTAGSIGQQEYGMQSDLARSREAINQFNLANRQNIAQTNLANRQRIAEQQAATRNQQEVYNRGLYQQRFQNELARAGSEVNVMGQQSQMLANQAQQQAQANQATMGALINAGATALSPVK